MKPLLNPIIEWIATKRRIAKMEYFMQNSEEVQQSTFQRLINQGKDTEWGKKFGYVNTKNYEQYRTQVPVSTYEDIFPYIQRMLKGEQNILWNSKINWFSKSSGTTNARSKFIPVSKESLESCHFQGGKDVMILYLYNRPQSQFFWGRGLSIGGTFQPNPEWEDSFYGDVSAVIVQNLPRWAQWLRTPPVEIAMLEKWEEKIEKMAEITLKQNVTSMLGVPTWTIVLLERILEITGKKNIKEVWENLEVFVHGAVAFTPYREYFNQLVGPTGLDYLETYNASEGFFGLQEDLGRDDMLLMLDYEVFYEFIPIGELDKEFPKSYTINEVELNKNYAMIISNNSGLWRYMIGDTVKFTSKNPYRIKITGRTKHFINAFGEEVIIENAETAISTACQVTGAVISNFTAAPTYMSGNHKGGHEWAVEFAKAPQNIEQFTNILDNKLREINSDYDAKRYQDIALAPPIIHSVPEGTFYQWLKERGKLGGQNKVPRLSNSREYLEQILALLDFDSSINKN